MVKQISPTVQLKRVLKSESLKSSKSMTMSLNTFKKLSSMLLTKHDDIVINEALRQFHEADKNGVKMEFSRGKTRAKINKNIEDYKAEI